MLQLSIIIPCYNESRRIPQTLPRLADHLTTLAPALTCEVLLVIEKSPDATIALARSIAAARPDWRVIDTAAHRGKGAAVRAGMLLAQGDLVCFMDADLSSDPAAIADALALLETRPALSLIAGDRRHPASIVTRNPGKTRPLFSHVFNLAARALFPRSIPTRDTQCGFKLFRAAAAREIFTRARLDGFAFDVEIFLLARRLGLEIATIPVCWTDAPHTTVRTLRHGTHMFFDLLRLRLRRKIPNPKIPLRVCEWPDNPK